MKKFLLGMTVFVVLLNGNDLENVDFDDDNFNLLSINPLLSIKDKKSKVYKSIEKGYQKQLIGLTLKVQKFNDIKTKHYFPQVPTKKRGKYKYSIPKDKDVSIELLELLKVVNEYYERNDKEKVVVKQKTESETSTKDGFDEGFDEELDFSESEITELTKKGDSVEDKYKSTLFSTITQVNVIYGQNNSDNLWNVPFEFGDEKEYLSPNVVFGEYFNPSKRGRRYFLSINIFIFIIDSDGDARVMVQEIGDYNWKRNYRFITAQSGKVIQDTIAKMTGTDIK